MQVDRNTYDLVLQNDINTRGFTQWFNFKVQNKRNNFVAKFNIVNLVHFMLFSTNLSHCTIEEWNLSSDQSLVKNQERSLGGEKVLTFSIRKMSYITKMMKQNSIKHWLSSMILLYRMIQFISLMAYLMTYLTWKNSCKI